MTAALMPVPALAPMAMVAAPARTWDTPERSWANVPSVANLDAYIASVNRMPLLTAEEELAFARALRDHGDVEAARKLVLSHLRLVVATARQYLGYGLPHADLIQEGNVGLMKAVKRFDPEQGVRLVSYALHWIKAEIHEYIVKNWRITKVATTKAQRKLFFNLRSKKRALQTADRSEQAALAEAGLAHDDTPHETLTQRQIADIARELDVKPEDVIEMETRLAGGDVALEAQADADDEERAFAPIAYLSDERHEPTRQIEARHRDRLATDGVATALAALDERSRRIVEERWLKVNDNGSGGMTLHELAAEYGISAERVRQIEVAAMKKMRATLAEYA
jgi:RNA polymerase sigma-32 factor